MKINSDAVQALEIWKMTAAHKDITRLQVMKENLNLRLQLSALRNTKLSRASILDAEIQAAGKEALTYLVKASGAVGRMLDLTESHLQEHVEHYSERMEESSDRDNSEELNMLLEPVPEEVEMEPVPEEVEVETEPEEVEVETVPEKVKVETVGDDPSRLLLANPLEGPSSLFDGSSSNSMMVPGATEVTTTVRRRRRAAPQYVATPSPSSARRVRVRRCSRAVQRYVATPSPRRSPHRSPPSASHVSATVQRRRLAAPRYLPPPFATSLPANRASRQGL